MAKRMRQNGDQMDNKYTRKYKLNVKMYTNWTIIHKITIEKHYDYIFIYSSRNTFKTK